MNSRERVFAAMERRKPDRVPTSVKPENFIAMVEATKKFGIYPIDAKRTLGL